MAKELGSSSFSTTDGLFIDIHVYASYTAYTIKDSQNSIFKAKIRTNNISISWDYPDSSEDGFSPIDSKLIEIRHLGSELLSRPLNPDEDAETIILQSVRKVAVTLSPEQTTLNEIENCLNYIRHSNNHLQILAYITTMQEHSNLLRDLYVLKAADAINKLNEARKTVANS